MADKIKGVPVAPLTGILDARSQPDEMAASSLRMRQNLQTVNQNTVRRGQGWQKLLSTSDYNNADFHDQLLLFQGSTREPITMISEVESSRKVRSLFLGTQSRLARLNQFTGNWQILGGGFGINPGTDATGIRFQSAVLGDYVFFTNGADQPQYCLAEPPPYNPLSTISDLALIGLTTARKCWVWRNVLFFADVVMDADRLTYRFVWSDYNNPTSFDPSVVGSITGFQDLDFGEQILGGKPSGNSFIICTNKGFWELFVVSTTTTETTTTGISTTTDIVQTGGTQGNVFGVRKISGIDSQTVVLYENTIVGVDDGILYMGRDRIYFYNLQMASPEPLEWLNLAGSLIYENIQSNICTANCAGYHDNEIVFSVLTNDSKNNCPDVSLRVNWRYKTADFIDSGFTAMCELRAQIVPTVRDFIIDKKICTDAQLQAFGYGWAYEGRPATDIEPTAPFQPNVIITHAYQYLNAYAGYPAKYHWLYGAYTEQWCAMYPNADEFDCNLRNPDSDSLCALMSAMGLRTTDDLCQTQPCDPTPIFVAASSIDWCLKQIGDGYNPVFYRERCTNTSAVGTQDEFGYLSAVGSYVLDGYDSIVRFAPAWVERGVVSMKRMELKYLTPPNSTSSIGLRIGISGQVADSNIDNCPIKWNQLSQKPLKCLAEFTAAQYQSKGVAPNLPLNWNFLYEGRFIHAELKISGINGDCLLSGVVGDVSTKAVKNY